MKEETNTGPEDRPVLKREPKGDWAIHSQFSFPASAVMSLLFLKEEENKDMDKEKSFFPFFTLLGHGRTGTQFRGIICFWPERIGPFTEKRNNCSNQLPFVGKHIST